MLKALWVLTYSIRRCHHPHHTVRKQRGGGGHGHTQYFPDSDQIWVGRKEGRNNEPHSQHWAGSHAPEVEGQRKRQALKLGSSERYCSVRIQPLILSIRPGLPQTARLPGPSARQHNQTKPKMPKPKPVSAILEVMVSEALCERTLCGSVSCRTFNPKMQEANAGGSL